MTLANCFQTIIGYPSNTTPVGATNNEFQSTGIYHTTLAADHTNGLYVQMIYYVTLSRDPDPAGFAFWTGIANGGGPGLLFQGNRRATARGSRSWDPARPTRASLEVRSSRACLRTRAAGRANVTITQSVCSVRRLGSLLCLALRLPIQVPTAVQSGHSSAHAGPG